MSTITIAGNLTADPELRSVNGGRSVVSFSIADNRRWADKTTGATQEAVTYLDVTAWGPMATTSPPAFAPGTGCSSPAAWSSAPGRAQDGQRRTKHELVATEVAASLRYAEASITRASKPDAEDDDMN